MMLAFMFMTVALLVQPHVGDLERALALFDLLDATTISVDYRNQPLQDVIDDLNANLPVPVRADWESLERLQIDAEQPVTLRIDRGSASSALAGLMVVLGDEFSRPVYEAHADQIIITTAHGTAPMRLTAVYDVRDLLANTALVQQLREQRPMAEIEPEHQTEPTNESSIDDAANDEVNDPEPPSDDASPMEEPTPPSDVPATAPGSNTPFLRLPIGDALPLPHFDDLAPTASSPGEELLLLIFEHVDPEAWFDLGGDRAKATEIDGVLMVTAPPSTHRRLRDAIERLRLANPANLAFDAAIVELPQEVFEQLSRQRGEGGALAAAIRREPQATTLWQTSNPVALGNSLQITSVSGLVEIALSLQPEFDQTAGLIRITVEASTNAPDDKRRIATSIAFAGNQHGEVLEIPAARQPAAARRLLVLTAQRR